MLSEAQAKTIAQSITYEPSHISIMGSISELSVDNVEIIGFTVTDLRFPTSLDGVGSDAMHVGTNGSHPYVRLLTNNPNLVGEGIVSCCPALVCQQGWSLTEEPICRLSAMDAGASSFVWLSISSPAASLARRCTN